MTETALYRYTLVIYEFMFEHSELNEHEEQVFVGSFTNAFKQVGASSTYYTPIRQLLLSPDLDPCISVLQRGNASQPSIIRLHHPPHEEWKNISHKPLTAGREAATLVPELERRIKLLEGWRESIGEVNLSEVLRNFELRITRLEKEREGNGT